MRSLPYAENSDGEKSRSMKKKIEIKCTGSKAIPIEELVIFQGDLKTLAPEDCAKLKKSILKHGFIAPFFVWRKNILDGTERLIALRELAAEGHEVPPLPVIEIEAKSEQEAAEIVLQLSSRYGKMTVGGLDEFMERFALNDEIIGKLALPEIDLRKETKITLTALPEKPPPKMVWTLIGVPVGDYGKVEKDIAMLASIEGIILESSIR